MSIITKSFLGIIFGLMAVVAYPRILASDVSPMPIVQKFFKQQIDVVIPPPPLDADGLILLINELRLQQNTLPLKVGKQTCSILTYYKDNRVLEPKKITSICPTCQKVEVVSLGEPISTDSARAFFTENATISATIIKKDFTHICAIETETELLVTLVSSVMIPVQPSQRIITEDELWKSLSEYRKSQGRSELSRDEKLCTYARKRVDDHLKLLADKKPKSEYPNPDKYPLDAHDGFKKDADTGYVFDVTGRSEVAENLAYWPNAEHAIHVIEWGWDQSKEGHREAQLSNEFSAACLTGKQGIFVAIFAR